MKTRRPSSAPVALLPAGRVIDRRQAQRLTEEAIHRSLVRHLEVLCRPGVVWWHTPNGERRDKATGGRLKAMGVKAGVPDLLLLREGRLYGIELKREGGRTSKGQGAMLDQMSGAGAEVAVCMGLDAALAALKGWGLIRWSGA